MVVNGSVSRNLVVGITACTDWRATPFLEPSFYGFYGRGKAFARGHVVTEEEVGGGGGMASMADWEKLRSSESGSDGGSSSSGGSHRKYEMVGGRLAMKVEAMASKALVFGQQGDVVVLKYESKEGRLSGKVGKEAEVFSISDIPHDKFWPVVHLYHHGDRVRLVEVEADDRF